MAYPFCVLCCKAERRWQVGSLKAEDLMYARESEKEAVISCDGVIK